MTTVTTEIRPTTVDELRRKAGLLMVAHWREVAKPFRELKPDWRRYQLLEDAGNLVLLAAWAGDRMVGYSVALVGSHSQDRDKVQMHCEALFVHENHRRQGVGTGLIAATEEAARELAEAHEVVIAAPVGSRLERLLAKRKDYEHRETLFVKEFG